MNMKRGCSMVIFLMLLVCCIFAWEFLKVNQGQPRVRDETQKASCSDNSCELGGPKKDTEDLASIQTTEIIGHDNGSNGSWAAPF